MLFVGLKSFNLSFVLNDSKIDCSEHQKYKYH